ncbi:30S ribosomal protein S5 [Haloferax mediterranei ATCC 33500]|uniref:Small ribosomal subunit protein uS5 n=2 Tax=Haloferax mediterranei (strain ATCC 33500 / DSM 1411 / JCM 8866 / NBRC 14739 / NCIMB 2177 / R-4) TaxID=523841 RepID=I3R7N9_HALMT|nr:30S ribosomal protein S5 [Haloferax mediterranei]AFK20249.2 30S ribosomal protein S5P [Haloferax mediterranei ATCC 33500]AHZ23619.1 30S ribosomal protein S5 [Haloferax mediterranei ATCC 33500]MDX5986999.1 30S ribosomal protein S5 [Haloferax mediterranei ATCC 33500]QCQ76316.1 30S ribosomal protein S5 [Haloferax mediterranei ATCC 33500]
MSRDNNGWEPRTRLGRMVQNGDVTSMDQALETGLPLKEPQIVDQLLPGMDDEVLDINMVQRMTDSGRRVKFRCVVAVGNRDGYLGYAEARDDQVGGAIQKAIEVAKLNIIKVDRGSGSWEDRAGGLNSLSRKAEGKAGSVTVRIIPAPQGLGLAAAETVRNILELAGIQDAWTKSDGNTRTTVNLAKATYNALKNASQSRTPRRAREIRREVRE